MNTMTRILAFLALLLPGAALAQPIPATGVNPAGGDASNTTVIAPDGTTASTEANRWGDVLNVKRDFGAKGDVASGTGSVSASSTDFNGGSITFTASDIGKHISVPGIGTGGATLNTTITAAPGGHATLATPAVVATGSSYATSVTQQTIQSGAGSYAPGDTATLTGGTCATEPVITVQTTTVNGTPTIAAAGAGGTNGSVLLVGTTGAGRKFIFNGTVSGGALTAVGSAVNSSSYTTNPTVLTAEPVVAYNLNGSANALAGAQLSLKMGYKRAVVSTPGVCAVTPANPVAQGSTSGSGTGATFNLAWIVSGGFSYGTDDSGAFTTAALAGKHILVPPGTYGVASEIVANQNFTVFTSQVPDGGHHDVGTPADQMSAALQWFGSPGGTMMLMGPTPGPSAQFMNGSGVSGIGFLCGGVAAIGLQALSVKGSEFSFLYGEECTSKDFEFGVVSQLGENGDFSGNIVRNVGTKNFYTTGVGIVMSGTTAGNNSFNTYIALGASHNNAPGIQSINADNNDIIDTHTFRFSGGNSYSIQLTGDANGVSRSIELRHISAAGGIVAEGTESLGTATHNNFMVGTDMDNGNPAPVLGIGTTFPFITEDGAHYGVSLVNGLCGETLSAAGQAYARRSTLASLYCYNGSQSGILLDDGTSVWTFRQDGSHNLELLPGSGSGGILLSATTTARVINPAADLTYNIGASGTRYGTIFARAMSSSGGGHDWSWGQASTTDSDYVIQHDSNPYFAISHTTGALTAFGGFISGSSTGLSVTKTVRAAGGAADCTLIFTGGLLTGGSC